MELMLASHRCWIKRRPGHIITTRRGTHSCHQVQFLKSSSYSEVAILFSSAGMPRPAPLLSRTPATPSEGPNSMDWGLHTTDILTEMGFSSQEIDNFLQQRIAQQADTTSKL